jgi:hypothetical protein
MLSIYCWTKRKSMIPCWMLTANLARMSPEKKRLWRPFKVFIYLNCSKHYRKPNPCWDIVAHSNLDSRSFLDVSYRSLLRSYITSPTQTTFKSLNPNSQSPSKPLVDFLSSPRIKHVDLNYIDNQSGTTLLHEAAKRKDLSLLELAIRAGADVFVRDRKGRPVYDASGTGKDDQVRVFLRQCKLLFKASQLTRLICFSHKPRYHTTGHLVFDGIPTYPQRLLAKVYQRCEGLQHKVVRAQGRNPLM